MPSSSPDRGRQRLRTVITIATTAALVAPAAALATHGFDDVGSGDFYHAAVDWMKDNDVTAGCNPPSNTKYCPEDFVTRGQMAVFFERLDSENVFLRPGEITTDGADAETLDGIDSTGFLRSSGKAADADKLDGKDSSAFLGKTQKAADADKLDGKDSSAFATAAELANLDAFIPIAVITIINGNFLEPDPPVANFRAPITAAPTYANTGTGEYTIELPGITFTAEEYPVVCSSMFGANIVESRATPEDFPGDPSAGKLQITLYDEEGNPQPDVVEDDFNCLVYYAG